MIKALEMEVRLIAVEVISEKCLKLHIRHQTRKGVDPYKISVFTPQRVAKVWRDWTIYGECDISLKCVPTKSEDSDSGLHAVNVEFGGGDVSREEEIKTITRGEENEEN